MSYSERLRRFAAGLIEGNSHIAPNDTLALTVRDSGLPFTLSENAVLSLIAKREAYIIEGLRPLHIEIDNTLDEEDRELLKSLFKAILDEKIDSNGRELNLLKVKDIKF